MAHRVVISLASNRRQKQNLLRARTCLEEILPGVAYTGELWTEPVGTTRPDLYLNQLAVATTALTADELTTRLKAVETQFGRTQEKRRLGIVPIDLDLLQYDEQRLHPNDWQRPYVQSLLPQLPHTP